MINPDLFAKDDEECYIFEQEPLSVEPSLDCFNIWEFSVDKDGQEALWDSSALDKVTGDR
jgi:hypothetical protein